MKKFKNIFVLGLGVLGLSSCLNDKMIEDQKYGMDGVEANKIIELPSGTSHRTTLALPFVNVDTVASLLTVRLAAKEPAEEDITVKLSLANSDKIIKAYNDENHTAIETFPSNLFSYASDGLTVVIPKGSRSADVKINVNPSKFNPASTYGLGFEIESVSNPKYLISGNYGTLLAAVAAKNKYDGIYTLRSQMSASDRPTFNTTTAWQWPGDVHLITSSGNQVELFDDWGFGTYILPIQTATGGWSGLGGTKPNFTFDLATNKITAVTNTTVPAPANGRAFQLDPTGLNYYDPATRTIYVSFIMTQPGFGPLKFTNVFVYKGSR